jgi:hypothetical protein
MSGTQLNWNFEPVPASDGGGGDGEDARDASQSFFFDESSTPVWSVDFISGA